MNKKEVYICVDAGGTTSKAAIFSKDGIILARGFSESGSPAVNYDRWYLNIEKSIIDAINHYPNPIKIIKMVLPPVERDVHVIPSTNLYTVPFLNAQKASCAKITPFNIPIPRPATS